MMKQTNIPMSSTATPVSIIRRLSLWRNPRIEQQVYNLRLSGKLPRLKGSARIIDIFSGAGGLTAGFTELFGHSFKPVWALDSDPSSIATYNENFGNHCLEADITEILKNSETVIPEADVVIGGPPCQGFSLLNRNRAEDSRRSLWQPFMEIVKRSNASVFVIENVPQLLDSPEYKRIKKYAEKLGFAVEASKMCSAHYGVSQVRWRAVVIGVRGGDPQTVLPPKRSHYIDESSKERELDQYLEDSVPVRTVRDAIGDLKPPTGFEPKEESSPYGLHFKRRPTEQSVRRYKAIPDEGMNRFDLEKNARSITPQCWLNKPTGHTDLFGRMWWGKPSVTIRTEFFKPEKGRYLHPKQHRPITHREAARLQSFPDEFVFKGSKTEIARQIGNAVPPLMAARIADAVYALLASRR